jgi:hypothetical protein
MGICDRGTPSSRIETGSTIFSGSVKGGDGGDGGGGGDGDGDGDGFDGY